MRLKVAIPAVAALVGLVVLAAPANASHCGAARYPVALPGPEVAAPAPAPAFAEQCCPPAVHHRICYQTIIEDQPRVCYRPVYQTVLKECRYTSMRPVYE